MLEAASRASQVEGRMETEITFVGGMALQSGMVQALEQTLGQKVNVYERPDLIAAIGAALLARQRLQHQRDVRMAA